MTIIRDLYTYTVVVEFWSDDEQCEFTRSFSVYGYDTMTAMEQYLLYHPNSGGEIIDIKQGKKVTKES